MLNLNNKWALVTGASRGVGLRIAKALANEGCIVILQSRNLNNTRELLDELHRDGKQAYAVAAELDTTEGINNLIDDVRKLSNDCLDILYNNAAIMTPYRDVYQPSTDEYLKSFMVNIIAPAKLCDAFLPGMLERNWGRVVNLTSGIADQPQLMPYSCSKAALDRYVRDMIPTLAGTNVLMNLLDPGWLRTDLGGDEAPNHPDSVIPGALVPVLLEQEAGSGGCYNAQAYSK